MRWNLRVPMRRNLRRNLVEYTGVESERRHPLRMRLPRRCRGRNNTYNSSTKKAEPHN